MVMSEEEKWRATFLHGSDKVHTPPPTLLALLLAGHPSPHLLHFPSPHHLITLRHPPELFAKVPEDYRV